MDAIFYKMPERLVDLAMVIRSLPDSWSGIRYDLSPEKRVYSTLNIVPGTSIKIDKRLYSAPSIAFDRRVDELETESMSWVKGIVIDGGLPEWVHANLRACDFDANSSPNFFKEARELAASFVYRGYAGDLDAYNARNGEGYYNSDDFEYKPEVFKARSHDRYLALYWHDNLGGKMENFEPVLKACRKLGLEKLDEDYVKQL